uniref:Uncharacterized protein n=1 Tax=Tetradesmus obliquus TaxID=3088 RepID=A0A383WII9_TETOB|eukprot:jgi/Sobl393_1/8790/SZX77280.1
MENVSPMYCANTPNPELVGEFNISSFDSSLSTIGNPPNPQLSNSIITVKLPDGRTFEIDPTLELTAGGLDSTAVKKDQIDGELRGLLKGRRIKRSRCTAHRDQVMRA